MKRLTPLILLAFIIVLTQSAVSPAAEDFVSVTDAGERRGGVVLALSGGGTKGFAHVGVLKVLEREHIPVVGIVGVSIGSVIGGLYASGYSADEILKIILDTNVMGLLADTGTRIKTDAGIHRPVGERVRLYHINLDEDFHRNGPLGMLPALSVVSFLTKYTGHLQITEFDNLPIPFACVATDLGTGEEVVMRNGNLASAIRASVAIPGLLEPWPIDGRLLVDGGLVANVPVAIAKEIFPGYPVIAVNLAGETITKPNERFRTVLDVMMQTIDIMTIDRIKANEALADLVVYPDVGMYSMLDSSGYDDIYQKGVSAAEENIARIVAISAAAPPPTAEKNDAGVIRYVRDVKIKGLHASLTTDIERIYREKMVGRPYNADAVTDALERISRLDEVATVDVDAYPSQSGDRADVDIVFSVEKRPPFEIGVDGYTSSMNRHRGIAFNINARDLASNGDAANLDIWAGNKEWGADARYFTQVMRKGQWGFSLGARKDEYFPDGYDEYSVERYSARIMYYRENMDDYRIGIGVAGEFADAVDYDKFAWGPYLYFNRDTLDNALIPSKGYSFNSQLWWNDSDILVSTTNLTAYIPWRNNLHFLLNFGFGTGQKDNSAYRVLLGDKEELLSLTRHPMAGDQTAWARIGVGKDFYNSWWGALRGDIFTTYGMIMDDWAKRDDMWEAGVSLSIPGQLLSGKLVMVYNDNDEFVFGFSLGNPMWHSSPLP